MYTRTTDPAEVYEACFVPALFGQWPPVLADAAGLAAGQRVLDVACGTGVLACHAAPRVGPAGAVTGLDANPQMLAVARRKDSGVEWVEGRAEQLPFADGRFDAVLSQFGLMFFDDRVAALREMRRVLRPGGRLAVAVCGDLAHSPAYAALARLLEALFGRSVADAFRAPFVLGDPDRLQALADAAGWSGARVTRHDGVVRFTSIEALVATERACAWTLGGLLDDAQFAQLLERSRAELAPFADAGGALAFALPALLVTAQGR